LAVISTYLPPFLPFFAAGPFLGIAGPPNKSKLSPPPPSAVPGLDGGGAGVPTGGSDPGVPGVLGAGVASLLGGALGVLGVPARTGGPAGVSVPTFIVGAVAFEAEGVSEEPEVGGAKAVFGGTLADFWGPAEIGVGGGGAAEPGRDGGFERRFGGGGGPLCAACSSTAA